MTFVLLWSFIYKSSVILSRIHHKMDVNVYAVASLLWSSGTDTISNLSKWLVSIVLDKNVSLAIKRCFSGKTNEST